MNIDKLYKQLDKNDQWIQNADVKLSIILTFLGVLGGYILAQENLGTLIKYENNLIRQIIVFLYTSASAFLLIGIFCSAKGIRANVINPKRGLWFFGDVAKYEEWHYFKRAKENETEEELKDDMLNQIYTTAKIAMYKFKWLNYSIFWAKLSLFLYLVYFIMKFFNEH